MFETNWYKFVEGSVESSMQKMQCKLSTAKSITNLFGFLIIWNIDVYDNLLGSVSQVNLGSQCLKTVKGKMAFGNTCHMYNTLSCHLYRKVVLSNACIFAVMLEHWEWKALIKLCTDMCHFWYMYMNVINQNNVNFINYSPLHNGYFCILLKCLFADCTIVGLLIQW